MHLLQLSCLQDETRNWHEGEVVVIILKGRKGGGKAGGRERKGGRREGGREGGRERRKEGRESRKN